MSEKTLRILLAESQPSEVVGAVRALFAGAEGGLQLTVVSTIATLLSSFKVADPEVILLDLSLYVSEPHDAVRIVRRAAPGVPLIVFADPADKQRAASSLAEGAIDYLLKGFMDPRTVDRALRSALERNTMEGLADLLRDPVTGLYTREGFQTLGACEQAEARRRGGALLLSPGHFSSYDARYGNDSYRRGSRIDPGNGEADPDGTGVSGAGCE